MDRTLKMHIDDQLAKFLRRSAVFQVNAVKILQLIQIPRNDM